MDNNFEQRLMSLENWRNLVDVTLGKNEVDKDYVKKELFDIKEEIKEFKGVVKNLTYTVWAALLLAFLKFAMSGGLASFI